MPDTQLTRIRIKPGNTARVLKAGSIRRAYAVHMNPAQSGPLARLPVQAPE